DALPPVLSWWQDARMLQDNDSASVAEEEASRSVLHIDFLQRSHFMARIICKARSGDEEGDASIILNMNLRPLRVAIAPPETVLVAEQAAQIRCDSWGSRPAANLSWWMGSRRMTRSAVSVDESSGHTSSLLAFTPGADDHGRRIRCRAANGRVPGSAIEDALLLEVSHCGELSEAIFDEMMLSLETSNPSRANFSTGGLLRQCPCER
ncbi:hypothetical protein MTO96_037223, partial [Rhipicephalus appendiculatus]